MSTLPDHALAQSVKTKFSDGRCDGALVARRHDVGAGEAGAIGSCPAMVNAIIEGLYREYKIDHIDMPATAERVWIAIREAQRRHNL